MRICGGDTWAFSDRDRITATAEVLGDDPTIRVEIQGADNVRIDPHRRQLLDLDPGILGVFIGRAAPELAGVDPSPVAFEAMLAERRQRTSEAAQRRAEQETRDRVRKREKALYGVELS